MDPTLIADGANAVIQIGTQLYMAEKAKKEAEEERRRKLLLSGQQNMGDAAEKGGKYNQTALDQIIAGFSGALL